jgi:Spy/CpxP family protein refolding chaperone
LTDNQKEKYEQIKQKYQFQAILAADSLHINQERLMGELMRNTSDSIQLKQLEEKVAECQGKLLHLSVEQYFEIKKILNPNQIPALDSLFAHILVCRPTCNHRDGDGGTIPHLN